MRTCAFCPSTKLTQEHVWGDWVNGILPQVKYSTSRKKHPDDNPVPWQSTGIQQTAKVVCGDCNNGWMSDLENEHAKPTMSDMIRYGRAMSILPRGIASLSVWAFKMAVIANFIGKLKNEPYFSDYERYRFAQTLQIPSGVQMWLFSLYTPNRVIGRFNSHLGRAPVNVKYGFEMYIATFAIGFFGLQVVASRWINPHVSAFMGQFPGLRQRHRWDEVATPFFPSDGSPVLWPPRLHLRSDDLDEFCNRWKDIEIHPWMVDGKLTD
jgi:hypothetical protein